MTENIPERQSRIEEACINVGVLALGCLAVVLLYMISAYGIKFFQLPASAYWGMFAYTAGGYVLSVVFYLLFVSEDKAPLYRYAIIGCIWGIVVVVALYFTSGGTTNQNFTKQEYAQAVVKKVNNDLANNPRHGIFRMVERAHVSVAAKSGSVTFIEVQTIDGSNFVGLEGSNITNISFVEMQITVFWDGWIHKNGRTVVEFVLYPSSDQVSTPRIVATDAEVNIKDPGWWREMGESFLKGVAIGIAL